MYQESYTLPNKERIRVSEIYRIDNMKDRGEGRHNPSFYKWSFLITFNNGEIKNVQEPYYYSNWGDARTNLEKIRNDLIRAFENYKKI